MKDVKKDLSKKNKFDFQNINSSKSLNKSCINSTDNAPKGKLKFKYNLNSH